MLGPDHFDPDRRSFSIQDLLAFLRGRKSHPSLYKLPVWLLVAGCGLWIFYGCFYNTSVRLSEPAAALTGIEAIHNLGLLNNRLAGILSGMMLVLVALFLFRFGPAPESESDQH